MEKKETSGILKELKNSPIKPAFLRKTATDTFLYEMLYRDCTDLPLLRRVCDIFKKHLSEHMEDLAPFWQSYAKACCAMERAGFGEKPLQDLRSFFFMEDAAKKQLRDCTNILELLCYAVQSQRDGAEKTQRAMEDIVSLFLLEERPHSSVACRGIFMPALLDYLMEHPVENSKMPDILDDVPDKAFSMLRARYGLRRTQTDAVSGFLDAMPSYLPEQIDALEECYCKCPYAEWIRIIPADTPALLIEHIAAVCEGVVDKKKTAETILYEYNGFSTAADALSRRLMEDGKYSRQDILRLFQKYSTENEHLTPKAFEHGLISMYAGKLAKT